MLTDCLGQPHELFACAFKEIKGHQESACQLVCSNIQMTNNNRNTSFSMYV